jgi:hypothetical protein
VFLSPTELDYWANFFLKYYRDGIGEVDHLDVEAYPRNPDTIKGLGIVLWIANVLPPSRERKPEDDLGCLDGKFAFRMLQQLNF